MNTRHEFDPARGQTGRAVRMVTRLAANQTWRYGVGLAMWVSIWMLPIVVGIIGQQYFDLLDDTPGAWGLGTVLAALFAWAVVRVTSIFVGMWTYSAVVFRAAATLQQNMFRWVLARPGAVPMPLATGEVVSRFRDDVEQTHETLDQTVDFIGGLVVGAISFVLLARIDLGLTIAMFIPLLVGIGGVRALGTRIGRVRTAARKATEDVTGFLGEAFGAAQSIKVVGAEAPMLHELERRNVIRRTMMVRDRTLDAAVQGLNQGTANIGTGVVLLLAAGTLATSRGITVGEFVLFTYLLSHLSIAGWMLGNTLAMFRRTGVSADRMTGLMEGGTLADLTRHRELDIVEDAPRPETADHVATPADTDHTPLLSARAVTHHWTRHDGADGVVGIADVDLDLWPGQFVVVTGRVGAGKTTLLRTLLGLLPLHSGTITWRGEPVTDPAATMVPPRAAYTPQVPRLFSMSLRDNLALGAPADDAALHAVIDTAAMGRDLAGMADGLDTLVGSRGMRLSGGQVQRAAAVRMLVRRPDLLVIDDVSSALDVETEAALWERLFRTEDATTALVVSHRRPALRRADLVVVLDAGRIVDRGTADELLQRSDLFRQLWG